MPTFFGFPTPPVSAPTPDASGAPPAVRPSPVAARPLPTTSAAADSPVCASDAQRALDRATISRLEGALAAATASKEGAEGQLNTVRGDVRGYQEQIALLEGSKSDAAAQLARIGELEGRTQGYQDRIAELEELATTDRDQLVRLQSTLEGLLQDKRHSQEIGGVNPLVLRQREGDKKEIGRLSALLDDALAALDESRRACADAEQHLGECRSHGAANDDWRGRVVGLEGELAASRESQAAADLRLMQMEEQLRRVTDDAALLRTQLSESQSTCASLEGQLKLRNAPPAPSPLPLPPSSPSPSQTSASQTQTLPPTTPTPRPTPALTPTPPPARASQSPATAANVPASAASSSFEAVLAMVQPRSILARPPPPASPSDAQPPVHLAGAPPPRPATAFTPPVAPTPPTPTPATAGMDDTKRIERYRAVNATLRALALDPLFQADLARPYVRSALLCWGGLLGPTELAAVDQQAVKEDPGVARVYPKIVALQGQCDGAGFRSFGPPVQLLLAGKRQLSREVLAVAFGVDFAIKAATLM